MPLPLSHRLAVGVIRFRYPIVIGWILLAVVARWLAPSFSDVAADGDFDYLPADLPSVRGGRLLDEAFPGDRARSQVVIVLSAEDEQWSDADELVAMDLSRRLHHRLAVATFARALAAGIEKPPRLGDRPTGEDREATDRSEPSLPPRLQLVRDSLDRAIKSDESFYQRIAETLPDSLEPTPRFPRLAIAFLDRGFFGEWLGAEERSIGEDYEAALLLCPDIPSIVPPMDSRSPKGFGNVVDIYSFDDPVIGGKLRTDDSRILILQLSSELAATENIPLIESLDELIDEVRTKLGSRVEASLRIGVTGSAAIGGETLMAARDAIRYTEAITVLMILIILAWVYRAPLLVAVPMFSIGLAVVVSMAVVTSLASAEGGWFRVFTTSRIFIVVILFGAGTDFCLFLISRLREEATSGSWLSACRRSLSGVSAALIGSAMTTVVGLSTLALADFGKFRSTGPIIAVCLLLGLAVCLTFAPAFLAILGQRAFWPSRPRRSDRTQWRTLFHSRPSGESTVWSRIALWLTRHPTRYFVAGWLLLLPISIYGLRHEDAVTFDISSELDPSAQSRLGLDQLRRHFNIGEINPVTLLLMQSDPQPRDETRAQVAELAARLYELPNVRAVRTADDPLGDFPPGREMSLLSPDGLKRRLLREHRSAQNYFFSDEPKFVDRLVRLDIAIDRDPFDSTTADAVRQLRQSVRSLLAKPDAPFSGSESYLLGTTASLIDLETVIARDNRRIKIAVIVAVLMVLVAVIRRWWLSVYLMATVLLSYYATLGLTVGFFRWMYGDDFVGLDWKLPVFLFVILVAIGQDYNVYLVTRILEEERRLGWVAALRRAVSRTGGIITACGLVMAATFFSMTASAWLPPILEVFEIDRGSGRTLRGIVELGFALGLGMLIDTFYVRTILVPSFVALTGRLSHRNT